MRHFRIAPFLLAIPFLAFGLLPIRASASPVEAPRATVQAPDLAVRVMGDELVDLFRIDNTFECGRIPQECFENEDPALMLARVALGESPSSPDDQVAIMWLIRFRADLGFKNSGVAGKGAGWCGDEWCHRSNRWGPPTDLYREALCIGGCQFSAIRAAYDIFYPCQLSEYHALRLMLCPTDEQLPQFYFAYQAAQWVLDQPLTSFPEELRGYDNFRSPSITGEGQCNRNPCGRKSRQFFPRANIWRDEFPEDNVFWAQIDARSDRSD